MLSFLIHPPLPVSTRKMRITKLEATNAELQTKLTEANISLRQVTIDRPLKQMSESISTCPELWLEQFSKTYRLELVDGELTLHSNDGKPVQHEGNAIPFERDALVAYLTDEKHPQAKAFRAITIVSRASGGANSTQDGASRKAITTSQRPTFQFGLR
jgi:hypothetical protein